MERAEPYLGRFLSRFLIAVVPGIAASALAAFVLYALHLSQTPEPAERLVNVSTASDDNMTAEERRELTRQMLKARRENPEIPVAVTPVARPTPATTAGTAGAAPPAEPKARPERTATAPPPRPARPAQPAAALPAQASSAATPSPAAAAGAPLTVVPPPAANPAAKLPPVNVTTAPEQAEPTQRSFAANVFSSLSTFAGTAANATGNTVNWMIALPGKAITAGGKLLTGDSVPASPPPAESPPPKQNLL